MKKKKNIICMVKGHYWDEHTMPLRVRECKVLDLEIYMCHVCGVDICSTHSCYNAIDVALGSDECQQCEE